ncbi:hypothetical protein ACIQMR_26760 [Streptomyces sp. NPDC091376]|uniref:hypothetical protein n=1 Tax=Streptomyces sp. NPDC091376 TaxID=3365994 RepID=UPI0037F47069
MVLSVRVRRLAVAAAAVGLFAGGAAAGPAGAAVTSSAPAGAAPASYISYSAAGGGDHDRCDWRKGHWKEKRVDGRSEEKWVKGRWQCRDDDDDRHWHWDRG